MFKTVSGVVLVAGVLAAATTFLDYKTSQPGPSRQAFVKSAPGQATPSAVTALSANAKGHFMAATLVNGVHVEMMADTGATMVALTQEDAQRIGIDVGWLDFNGRVQTANGIAEVAMVTLDEVEVGQVAVRDVRAVVVRSGALAHSLLGMSFIGALSRFEMKGDQLLLVQ